jgi:Fe-S cluster biogenesis protein NfuA/nitrite reductase/ring-hydroxylating ferredoxin subunit
VDHEDVQGRVARVESLLEEVEGFADPVARATATELVQGLLDLYGEGLGRIVARLAAEDAAAAAALGDDELVAHLLFLHDLHPVPVEERVGEALASVRPYLESHGGGVELIGVEDGVARLRLQGSCDGCPSSAMTLKLAVEDAIRKAAPDIEQIEADGASAPEPGPALLQIEVSDAVRASGPPEGAWATAGALPDLSGGGTAVKRVAGEPVLFARVDGTPYAYRPVCPGCDAELEGATLDGAELACPACTRRYDVRRAGRCLDDPERYLAPVPLLVDDAGLVKVALSSGVG